MGENSNKNITREYIYYERLFHIAWNEVIKATGVVLPCPNYKIIWPVDKERIYFSDGLISTVNGRCFSGYKHRAVNEPIVILEKMVIYIYHGNIMYALDEMFTSRDYIPLEFMNVFLMKVIIHEMCHYIRNYLAWAEIYKHDRSDTKYYDQFDKYVHEVGKEKDEIETDEMARDILIRSQYFDDEIDAFNKGIGMMYPIPDPDSNYMRFLRKVKGEKYVKSVISSALYDLSIKYHLLEPLAPGYDNKMANVGDSEGQLHIVKMLEEYGRKYPIKYTFFDSDIDKIPQKGDRM